MSIWIDKKENCFGCGACFNICPEHAITMKRDEEGFLYPIISGEKCSDCGQCEMVCPALKKEKTKVCDSKYFGFQIKDLSILRQSASGGAFSALAQLFYEDCSGKVSKVLFYGAALLEDGSIGHRAVELKDLHLLRNSKYVESRLGNCYEEIAEQIKKGAAVMFSGTPCQVQGLKAVLENLCSGISWEEQVLLVDIVCNGVGSPEVWDCYRKSLEQAEGKKIKEYTFRDKRSARSYAVSWRMEDGSERIEHLLKNRYWLMYQRGFILRPSCHQCPYTNTKRGSDVTIGDFHGLEEENEFSVAAGVSLVIGTTKKGKAFCEEMSSLGVLKEFPEEKVLQPRLQCAAAAHPLRKNFLKDVKRLSFEDFMKKYGAMIGEKRNG